MLRIIVNCGPHEEFIAKCLASIRSQSFVNWQAYVTVDPCGDLTFQQAVLAAGADSRIHIHRNISRQYSMVNLIGGIRRSGTNSEDIIVVLDGDDWFATADALRVIHDTYRQSNCWMTYGTWVADKPLEASRGGMWPAYSEDTTDFRNSEWLGTAVRTWKRWLWELIDDRDFRDAEGNYLRITEDQAAMMPMLEMSGTRNARHISEVLMVYNRSSPHACGLTRPEEMFATSRYVKTLPPYSRLIERPSSDGALQSHRSRRASFLTMQQCCIS
jgi:glycosyltransferase involved in cell wall biosynthesis